MKFIATLWVACCFLPFANAANPRKIPPPTEQEKILLASIQALRQGTPEQCIEAAKALIPLGPKAVSAVPALTYAFETYPAPTVGRPIAEALAAIGPGAHKALTALVERVEIRTADPALLHYVSRAIIALGDPANPSMIHAILRLPIGHGSRYFFDLDLEELCHAWVRLPILLFFLQAEEEHVRVRAAYLVRNILTEAGSRPLSVLNRVDCGVRQEAIKAMREALNNSVESVRECMAESLIAADPHCAKEMLSQFATERSIASRLIHATLQHNPVGVQLTLDFLDRTDLQIEDSIVGDLQRLPSHTWPGLVDGLHHRNPKIRKSLIRVLGENQAMGLRYLPLIIHALKDDNSEVRLAAALALADLDPNKAGLAIPQLLLGLQSDQRSQRISVLKSLEKLGKRADCAVKKILLMTTQRDSYTRYAAAEALVAIDSKTIPVAVQVFMDVIKTDGDAHQVSAIQSLRELGKSAKAALPVLRPFLNNPDRQTIRTVAKAICIISPNDCDDAVQTLGSLLCTSSYSEVIDDLRSIGFPARKAIPALIELSRSTCDPDIICTAVIAAIRIDSDSATDALDLFRWALIGGLEKELRKALLNRLSYLGKDAKVLVPELIHAVTSRQSQSMESAVLALKRIGPDAKVALPELRKLAKDPKIKLDCLDEAIVSLEAAK